MVYKARILVVESKNDENQQLAGMLQLLGYQVQIVASGADAFDAIDDSIQLILCRDQLIDMSGFLFTAEVARCSYDIPVILLVQETSYETRKSVFECGAINYLCSPFIVEEVVAQLKVHIPEIDSLDSQIADVSMLQILTLVAQETNNAVILTDAEGHIEWVNQGFVEMTGYTVDEVSGEKPGHILRGGESDLQSIEQIDKALQDRRAFHTKMTNYTKSGQKYHVSLYIEPIYRNGQLAHFIGIEQDITARVMLKDLEKETQILRAQLSKEEEINKLQTSFVTMVSHEFRTPLTIIRTASDTLLYYNDRLSDSQRQQRLTKINEQIEHLTSMMEDVLIINRVNQKDQQVICQYADLEKLTEKIVNEFRNQNITQIIRLSAHIPSRSVYLDADLFKQIVMRLLSNAITYSYDDGVVDVQLRESNGTLFLTVSDKGIGIPSADLPNVFEAFYRGSNVGQIHGIGMGLNIVHHAIVRMNGKIRLHSIEGEGTQVTVCLPMAD